MARDLDAAALGALGGTVATSAPMDRGDYLYRAGDAASAWYVVRSGVYKTINDTADGEEYVTGFYYPGEILGLEGAASGQFEESAVALGSATACTVMLESLPRIWALGRAAVLGCSCGGAITEFGASEEIGRHWPGSECCSAP